MQVHDTGQALLKSGYNFNSVSSGAGFQAPPTPSTLDFHRQPQASIQHPSVMPEDSGERVRQLCYRVISLSESDPDFQPALQELRNAIHDSMTRARERVVSLAVVDAYENQTKAAD